MSIYVTTDDGKDLDYIQYENSTYDSIREDLVKDSEIVYAWFSLEAHIVPDFETGEVPYPDYIREGEVY